jgi:hypothetical protein
MAARAITSKKTPTYSDVEPAYTRPRTEVRNDFLDEEFTVSSLDEVDRGEISLLLYHVDVKNIFCSYRELN